MNAIIIIAFLIFACSQVNAQSPFIKDLMNKMSVEDKCGQMTQVTFDVISKPGPLSNPDENPIEPEKLLIAIRDKRVGSILATPYSIAQKAATWQNIITSIQDQALTYNLKIPVLYGLDSIHGANYIRESTLFPQPLSM
jgi:beta-glucosidase